MKKLLLFLTICLLASNVFASTLSEIRTRIRLRLRDNGTSETYIYTDANLLDWINEAHGIIINRVLPVKTRTHINTSSTRNPNEYSLPSDFVKIDHAYIINTSSSNRTSYSKLDRKPIRRLADETKVWDDITSGTPTSYYLRYTTSSVLIGLSPFPNAAHAGTKYLRVDYTPRIAALTSSDEPFYGLDYLEGFQYMLEDYTIAKARNDFGYLKLFDADIEKMKNDLLDIVDMREIQ